MDVDALQRALHLVVEGELGSEGIVQGWLNITLYEDIQGDQHITFTCSDHMPMSSSIGALTIVLDDLREASKTEGMG